MLSVVAVSWTWPKTPLVQSHAAGVEKRGGKHLVQSVNLFMLGKWWHLLVTTAFFRLGEGISASQLEAEAQRKEWLNLYKASWEQWRHFKSLLLINILFNFILCYCILFYINTQVEAATYLTWDLILSSALGCSNPFLKISSRWGLWVKATSNLGLIKLDWGWDQKEAHLGVHFLWQAPMVWWATYIEHSSEPAKLSRLEIWLLSPNKIFSEVGKDL